MKIKNTLKRYTRLLAASIPLLGRLHEVSVEGLKQALYETCTTIVFATMPFWILPAVGHYAFNPKPSVDEGFRDGGGLIYASVLLGPLFYVLTKRYGRWAIRRISQKHVVNALSMSFPYGTLFIAIIAFTCVISGFAFALLYKGLTAADIDQPGIQTLSWVLVITA